MTSAPVGKARHWGGHGWQRHGAELDGEKSHASRKNPHIPQILTLPQALTSDASPLTTGQTASEGPPCA